MRWQGMSQEGVHLPQRSQREETLCSIRCIWITTMRTRELPQPWAPSQFCWGSWQWWATQPSQRQAPMGEMWEEAPVASSWKKVCAQPHWGQQDQGLAAERALASYFIEKNTHTHCKNDMLEKHYPAIYHTASFLNMVTVYSRKGCLHYTCSPQQTF